MNWNAIFEKLEGWRETLRADKQEDPAVSTVAETFNQDPWAVLASTILSLRTKDDVTMRASRALLERAPSPSALLQLSEEEVARLIFPVGFYKTKAHNLLAIARAVERDGVPADIDALLALPGVGRKTANLVLSEAFDRDALCVDIHVHRISNRAGWVSTKTAEETEFALCKIMPQPLWKRINKLLVLYGQRLCRPLSPFCSHCIISEHCARVGVTKSR